MTSLDSVRFSQFNAFLNRSTEGQLIRDLSAPDDSQAQAVAEIIQRVNPNVLLINEFDFDPNGEAARLFQENYLSVSQNGATPVEYPYVFLAPSNTGIPSGFDLDNNGDVVTEPGSVEYGNDAFGFGFFPGQFGMVLFSKYPIVEEEVRTFQNFLWKDMPGALLPDDSNTPEPQDWYSSEELEAFRLSSKNHWDVPIEVDGEIIHVLASHPTPPVFDGPEDRNGKRNHDEIRFWSDYITPAKNAYIYDDAGNFGGLSASDRFVIMGDQNADPFDGDSTDNAVLQLLGNPSINSSVIPASQGGIDATERQGGANVTHLGNPAFDTGDFTDVPAPGNLRVDYVLPSWDLDITDAAVFWPASDDPLFRLVGDGAEVSSDHRLVWADVAAEPTVTDSSRKTVADIEFLGEVTFPTEFTFDSTEVGGISGLTYNPFSQVYYALSDDRSQIDPARFYTLNIDLSDGSLDNGDVMFTDVTTLLDADGDPFSEGEIDPEGIAFASTGTLFISSEGDANNLINPFVNEFSLAGQQFNELPVPEKFLPTPDGTSGIRNNLAFESLTITPDEQFLYTATENALLQDVPAADIDSESLSRIIKYDLSTDQPVQEFVYRVEPVPEVPDPADASRTNGLVELLALDNSGTFLALERSFSEGKGNTVKLYEARSQGALDVSGEDDLFFEEAGVPFEIDPPVAKRELLDFSDLGLTPDNLEGLVFGSQLPDGRQSLIVVSDNNFNPDQTTQFIALALDLKTTPAALPTVETPPVFDVEEPPSAPPLASADDPAVYLHPTNPSLSLVITALKNGGLQVHDLNGQLLQTLAPESPDDLRYNNVDTSYNFNLGGQPVDLAIASDRLNDTLAIFRIDPTTRQLTDITAPGILETIFGVDDGEQTAYGLANYVSPISGKVYTFVTQADGNQVAQLELVDNGEGQVDAQLVRMLAVPIPEDEELDAQTEGIVADQELGFVYIGQEDVGIWKFSAEPDGGTTGTLIDEVAPNGNNLVADVEGLTLYYGANGTGYLIASSQGDSTFAVYGREGNNDYLGSFIVGESNGIDSTDGSDGLDVINVPLGSQFPYGLLVVHDEQNEPAFAIEDDGELTNVSGNFKFVPWENVANAFPNPLAIDTTSFDPRNPTPLNSETLASDTLVGTLEDNFINGLGEDGDDLIRGGLGNEILVEDDFFGGNGSDPFLLAAGEGTDTIGDFRIDEKLIDLAESLIFGRSSITQDDNSTLIGLEDETLAILTGLVDPLTSADFVPVG